MDIATAKLRLRIGGWRLRALFLALTVCGAARLEAAMDVSLTASPSDPAPVGTMITWNAAVFGAGSSDLFYRFRVSEAGGGFHTIRDYGPLSTLDWTSIDEGVYEIELSVRDRGTLEVATTRSSFQLQSRVSGGQAVISPTSHPLVFLFSSPGCDDGEARVRVQSSGGVVQSTPYKPCVPGQSLNFYIAGLAPGASYSASLAVDRGRDSISGPAVTFETGVVPAGIEAPSVVQSSSAPGSEGILLQTPLYQPAIATDLNGALLWFGPSDLTFLTSPAGGGTFLGLLTSGAGPEHDIVRRFDLIGMTVQETNVARVNEQLAAMGKRAISGFHHDARSLPGGRTVLLADVEQILTDVQGPGPVDVIGDMILVLDEDLQVVWTWDTFDYLDTSRRAVLGETCLAFVGCATHYLSADANDWTHGNSVEGTPDGALLYSSRHQDWLIKIDYQDGAGNGDIVWRLGKDGDFTYDSDEPYPWFSHQHDPTYESRSRSTITLFDNGNTRLGLDPGGFSRGQAIQLDEEHRIARLVLNEDLGVFSSALGSAQRLLDGTYAFDAGFVSDPDGTSGAEAFSIQIDPSGDQVVSSIKLPGPVYRSFRVTDLYGPADAPARYGSQIVDFRD
jgi:arylsulfate sulfotransferase